MWIVGWDGRVGRVVVMRGEVCKGMDGCLTVHTARANGMEVESTVRYEELRGIHTMALRSPLAGRPEKDG